MLFALATIWIGLTLAYFSVYSVGFYVATIAFVLYLACRVSRTAVARIGRRATAAPAIA